MEKATRWQSQYVLSGCAAKVAEQLDQQAQAQLGLKPNIASQQQQAKDNQAFDASHNASDADANPTQTFFTWLEKIEEQRGNEQERVVVEYLDLLKSYKDRSQGMKAEISAALTDLEELRQLHSSVSSQTSAIHLACEQLLHDERALVQSCDAVSARLQYFKDYDRFRKLINSPTLSVMSDQFIAILSRLDECIIFLSDHQDYQDAQMYVTRFRHLRNKGLALAHTRITNTIRSLMQPQSGEAATPVRAIRADDRAVSQVRTLMEQLERRRANGEEYGNLLQACYNFYFEQRHNIRADSIAHMIESNLREHHANLPRLVRNGCQFMKTLCEEERIMYNRFFTTINEGFHNMIDGMTRRFYDAVRPLILQRAVSLDGLIQLCTVINVEVLEDEEVMSPFASVAEELLADVQERLTYRAQTFIDTSVRRYSPTKPDVDYPARLQLGTAADATASWYPPITRALTLLSQLYRSLERSVCEGIAQEILDAALSSLHTGARLVKAAKGAFHADLFMIKHLLVLREQIAPFDFAFAVTEVGLDFSSIRDAAVSLLSQTNTLFRFDKTNALYSFLVKGAPAVTKDRLDARQQIDTQLRDVCRAFIEHEVQVMVAPIKSFLQQVEKMSEKQRQQLPAKTPPEKLRSMHASSQTAIATEVEKLRKFLNLYLQSSDTETILFKPMKNGVLEAYRMVQELLSKYYSDNERASAQWPSLDTVSAQLSLTPAATPAATSTEVVASQAAKADSSQAATAPITDGVRTLNEGEATVQTPPATVTVGVSAVSNGGDGHVQSAQAATTSVAASSPSVSSSSSPTEATHMQHHHHHHHHQQQQQHTEHDAQNGSTVAES